MDYYIKRLKAKGIKITPRRMAIIDIFIASKSHLTPEDVWHKLGEKFDKCGLPGVYRNLRVFAECGVVTRIHMSDGKKHYGLCAAIDRHHHHIICVRCGKVAELNKCAIGQKRRIDGYKIIRHFIQVDGICKRCLA